MHLIFLATGSTNNLLDFLDPKSVLASDEACFKHLKTYWTHMYNEESNEVSYNNSEFIKEFTRLFKPNLRIIDKRDTFWTDHQDDPGFFMSAFFQLGNEKVGQTTGEEVNTTDGFHGIATEITLSCNCGERRQGKIQNDFILRVEIVHDDGKLYIQDLLHRYFQDCKGYDNWSIIFLMFAFFTRVARCHTRILLVIPSKISDIAVPLLSYRRALRARSITAGRWIFVKSSGFVEQPMKKSAGFNIQPGFIERALRKRRITTCFKKILMNSLLTATYKITFL
jgi:hypothetical protein